MATAPCIACDAMVKGFDMLANVVVVDEALDVAHVVTIEDVVITDVNGEL